MSDEPNVILEEPEVPVVNIGSNDSILLSIKNQLGIFINENGFDNELIMCINSIFSTLYQIGVGPENGYTISDATALWTDYLTNETALNMVKSYMYLKVRLLFDPPINSSYLNAVTEMCKEYEWRMSVFGSANFKEDEDEETP